jgi:hypothetical protein
MHERVKIRVIARKMFLQKARRKFHRQELMALSRRAMSGQLPACWR